MSVVWGQRLPRIRNNQQTGILASQRWLFYLRQALISHVVGQETFYCFLSHSVAEGLSQMCPAHITHQGKEDSSCPRTLWPSVTRKACVPGETGDVWLWWGCWGMVCSSKGRAALWDEVKLITPQEFYIPAHRFVPVSASAPLCRLSQLGENMQHFHFLL